ncbi:MAG: hypothetical protein ABUK01_00880 [Leptospirales bacterium]
MATKKSKKQVFITGDVHDSQLRGYDSKWLKRYHKMDEIDCALKYGELAEKYKIPVTLFFTGRCLSEQKRMQSLQLNSFVEFGAHTYNALQPSWLHLIFKLFLKSYYGPLKFQLRDILKTQKIFRNFNGDNIQLWRTHAYQSNNNTLDILRDQSFKVISDDVRLDGSEISQVRNGLYSVPINTPPDHENLYHGFFNETRLKENKMLMHSLGSIFRVSPTAANGIRFTKELIKKLLGRRPKVDLTKPVAYSVTDYFSHLKKETEEALARDGYAMILLHPGCMEIADKMNGLEDFFLYLGKFNVSFLGDAELR